MFVVLAVIVLAPRPAAGAAGIVLQLKSQQAVSVQPMLKQAEHL
jgi:hypothetical protein